MSKQWIHKRKNKKFLLVAIVLLFVLYFIIIPLNRFPQLNDSSNMYRPIILPNTYNPKVNLKNPLEKITDEYDNDDEDEDSKVQGVDLRTLLMNQFPYDPLSETPKHIWQTWKVNLDSSKFPTEYRTFSKSWREKTLYDPLSDLSEQDLTEKHRKTLKDEQWVYSLIDDSEVEKLIEIIFHEVPAIVQAFQMLPSPILKADFFRYLILYARGGIYSDMDTIPLKFLNQWPGNNKQYITENVLNKDLDHTNRILYQKMGSTQKSINFLQKTIKNNTPGLVIGIEADPDRPDWNDHYARRIQFCQWTIQAKPGHPVLRELILNITETTLNSVSNPYMENGWYTLEETILQKNDFKIQSRGKRYNKDEDSNKNNLSGKKLKNHKKDVDGTDIMNWTGPGIFSDTVFSYMDNLIKYNQDIVIVNKNLDYTDTETTTKKFYKDISTNLVDKNKFHWGFFSLLKDPVLVDDILVLPITAFSPDVGHMGSMSSTEDIALAKHFFSGSWKDN